jgi:dethiobiotin synthetase
MKRSLFVTGTDTGVGKSLVACALIEKFKAQGLRVTGMKPVASGGVMTVDGLRNEDALALRAVSNVDADYDIVNPYCFEPAIAPHLAAAEAGVNIDFNRLKSCHAELLSNADVVVVEGAGGWKVPLAQGFLSDFPESLQMEVVLVVGLRLGCLNHAVLTASSIEQGRCCALLGWVGNVIDPLFPRLDGNLGTLKQRLNPPCLGLIPHLDEKHIASIADLLDISALNPRQ